MSEVFALPNLPEIQFGIGTFSSSDWDRWHEWLRQLPLETSEEVRSHALKSLRFTAPVRDPWNIFQTYHNFDRPNRVTGAIDPPKAQRYIPDVFLRSRTALAGYGEIVEIEPGGAQFDFEIEVTAVIGKIAHRYSCARQYMGIIAASILSNAQCPTPYRSKKSASRLAP